MDSRRNNRQKPSNATNAQDFIYVNTAPYGTMLGGIGDVSHNSLFLSLRKACPNQIFWLMFLFSSFPFIVRSGLVVTHLLWRNCHFFPCSFFLFLEVLLVDRVRFSVNCFLRRFNWIWRDTRHRDGALFN
jgi:hypothetical protein